MKKFLEKLIDEYIKYKSIKDKGEIKRENMSENLDHSKQNLDDFDDRTEDEAEDLLTWGKTDLLHN